MPRRGLNEYQAVAADGVRRCRSGADKVFGHRCHSLACAFGTASSCRWSTPHYPAGAAQLQHQ
jgi:hypothetical protein